MPLGLSVFVIAVLIMLLDNGLPSPADCNMNAA
jgi:hypothetical protein